MLMSEPATLSKEPPPMRWPLRKTSSMKRSDGGLIGDGVVDEVLLRPGRDDEQGLTRAVAAASLRWGWCRSTPARAAAQRLC